MTRDTTTEIGYTVLAFGSILIIGLLMDYISRKKSNTGCSGHRFTHWHFDHEIDQHYKNVYHRQCTHCNQKQTTKH